MKKKKPEDAALNQKQQAEATLNKFPLTTLLLNFCYYGFIAGGSAALLLRLPWWGRLLPFTSLLASWLSAIAVASLFASPLLLLLLLLIDTRRQSWYKRWHLPVLAALTLALAGLALAKNRNPEEHALTDQSPTAATFQS